MKKHAAFLVLLALGLSGSPAAGQATIYSQNFDTDNGGYTTGDPDTGNANGATAPWQWGVPTTGPGGDRTGGQELWATNLTGNYTSLADQYVASPTISLGGYQNTSLSVWAWYNFETFTVHGLSYYDGALFEAYNGTSWALITPTVGYDGPISASGSYVNTQNGFEDSTGNNGIWRQLTFDLSAAGYDNNANFRLRCVMGSDSSGVDTGIYFDDVVITGNVIPPRNLDSITITQASTDPVEKPSANNQILRVQFVVSNSLGTITLNSITIGNVGTEAGANVSPVKVWFTTTSTFSTTEQLGANGTFSGGSVTITPLSAKQLPTGTSYLWVSLDVAAGATLDNTADASITALAASAAGGANNPQPTIDAQVPANGNPAGSRRINQPLKKWNGGGWNLRPVNGTDPSAPSSVVAIRLDNTTSPTGATVWGEALGSLFAQKRNSIRIFRNKSGSWSELGRDLISFNSLRCILNFRLPADHVGGDLYYLATGGQFMATPPAASPSTLTWTVIDDFEDNNLAVAPAWTVSAETTSANDVTMADGSIYAMKIADTSASSIRYGYTAWASPTGAIVECYARASVDSQCFIYGADAATQFTWEVGVGETDGSWSANTWYLYRAVTNETANIVDAYANDRIVITSKAYLDPDATANIAFSTNPPAATPTGYIDYIRYASYALAATHTLGALTAGDSFWNTPANWDPLGVPTASNDVLISGSSFNYQPTFAGGGSTRSVTIAPGNTLTVASSTLTLAGYIDVNGTLTQTGGEVRFASTANAWISALSGAVTFGNLTIDPGAFTVSTGTTLLTITGTLNLASGTLSLGTNILTLQGGLTRTSGVLAATLYTIQPTGSANQAWALGAFTINNLTLNKSAGTVTLTGNLTITNRLTLAATNAGNLDLGSGTHALNGTNDSAAEGTGSFVVNGGRLDVSTSTVTTQARLNVGASGTVRMDGGGTLQLPASGANVLGVFKASVTTAGRPTVTRIPAGSRYSFVCQDNATVELYGLNFDYPDTSGLQVLDVDGSGFVRVDDVKFTNGDTAAGSSYLNCSGLNSGVYTLRLNSFDGACPITVRLRGGNTNGTPNPLAPASTAQIRMENSTGLRGDNDASTGGGIAEDFDGDPDGDTHITWVFFRQWTGSVNSIWSLGGNWQGGTAPANSGDGEDVLILPGTYSPILDQNWIVRSFSIATGASFSLGSSTLTITGDNFQAFGGNFDPSTGTVALSGTTTQLINIGTNPLWNLIIYKPSGTANLATNLRIRNALRIIDGTFDLKGYALIVGADGGTGLVYVNDERASGNTTTAVLGEVVGEEAMPPGGPTPKDSDGSIIGATTSSMTILSDVRVRGDGTDRGLISLSGSAVWTESGSVNPAGSSNVAGRIYLAGSARLVMGDGAGTDVLSIPAGGILEMNGGSRLEMRTTGTAAQASIAGSFKTTTSGSTKPTITSANGTNGFVFTVSGTVDISGLKFSYGDSNGLNVASTSATLTNLNFVDFSNKAAVGAYHLRIVRSVAVVSSVVLQGHTFDAASNFNVRLENAGAAVFTAYMSNATGSGSGSGYESQQNANSQIEWVENKTWVGNWQYRRPVTITNADGANPLVAGATVEVEFDHAALIGLGKSLGSGNDVRVVYWNGSTGQELDRLLIKLKNNDSWGNAATRIAFKTVAAIAAGGNSDLAGPTPTYFIYYGNALAGAPPANSINAGVAFFDGFESGNLTAANWTTDDIVTSASSAAGDPFDSSGYGAKMATFGTVIPRNLTRTLISTVGFVNVYAIYAWQSVSATGPADPLSFQADTGAGFATVGANATNTYAQVAPRAIAGGAGLAALGVRFLHDWNQNGDYARVDSVRLYTNQNGALNTFSVGAEESQTGKWADPFNWSPPGVPGANSAVVIDEAAVNYQYAPNQNTGSSQTILGLTIGDVTSGGLTLTNALVVTRDVSVDTNGAQTALTLNANLTVGGDWVHTEGNLAGASTVLFDRGAGVDQKMRGTASLLTFPAAVTTSSANPVKVTVEIPVTITGATTIASGHEIEIAAGKTLRCLGAVSVTGTLDIEAGATLSLSANTVTVNSAGTLEAVGTSSSRASIYDTVGGGGFAVNVNEGATVNMDWFELAEPGTNGLKLGAAGAGSVTITALSNGWFHKPAASGVLLNTSQLNGWLGAFAGTISGCRFELDGGGATPAAVQGGTEAALHPVITMATYVGDLATDELTGVNTDVNNLINWGAVTVPQIVDDASSPVAADASGGGLGIQVGDTVKVKFGASTNAPAITTANIATALVIDNDSNGVMDGGKTWGTIQSATWSTTTVANDTLTIALGTGAAIVVGDLIRAPAASIIKDVTVQSSATNSATPSDLKGSFGANTPRLISAVAYEDTPGPGGGEPGPGAGDYVVLRWDKATNGAASGLTAANIDSILVLDGAARSWGTVTSVVWSTTSFANDTLTVTLSAAAASPVRIGSSIVIATGTIKDDTSTNNAVGSPPTIGGTFGPPQVTLAIGYDDAGTDKLDIRFDNPTNQFDITTFSTQLPLAGGTWGTIGAGADTWVSSTLLRITLPGDHTIAPGTTTLLIEDSPATIRDSTGAYSARPRAGVDAAAAITGDFTMPRRPVLVSAVAEDTSGGGGGIQSGDRLVFTYDLDCDTADPTIANIDTTIPIAVNDFGAITSASWPVGTVLVVVFNTGATLVVGDAVAFNAGGAGMQAAVIETTGGADATPNGVAITGTFGTSVTSTTWNGSASSVWGTPGNWSAGVPGINTSVTIPDVATDPIISSPVTIRNLTIQTGGYLTVNSSLTITTLLQIDSGGTLKLGSGGTLILQRVGTGFPPEQHIVAGVLELVSGTAALGVTTVKLGDFQQLVIDSGGTLKTTAGTEGYSFGSNRYVLFTRNGASGGYSVYCRDGSVVDIQFVKILYLYGRSTAGRNEFTEATVESAFAVSANKANITRFAVLWFDQCVDPAGPNARFPRYLYFLEETNDAKDWNGMAGLGYLDRLRFENGGGLASQSNIEKRCPAGGTNTTIYPRNNKDNIPPVGAPEDDDMDGGRGAGDTGVEDITFYENPTAVMLADLVARGYDGAVVVEWRTAQEFSNLGFNVYRSRFPDRDFYQVNQGLILGMGDSAVGGRYYLRDGTVTNGVRYYYMLEDVDIRGTRTLHGPVDALPEAGAGTPALVDSEFVNRDVVDETPGTVVLRGLDEPPDETGSGTPSWSERLLGIDLAAAGIRLISYDETGAVIEILPPEARLTPEMWEGRLQTRISMAGYSATRVVGMPEVPTKGILLVTPEIERAGVRILEVDSRSLTGMDLVRTRPPGLPGGFTRSGGSGGGTSGGTRSRPRSLTVMEMIAEAREELMGRILAAREELAEARKKGRDALANRGRPRQGGALAPGGAGGG
ncbi:MAG: hypothetical protein HY720_33325, partial [Planctomycetes bacterium]|nr:hypothetical protein [Planctomycetota bacterium]